MSLSKFPVFVLLVLVMSNAYAQKNDSSSKKMDPEKSILQNTEASGQHNLLLAAVKVSELDTALNNDGPYTVFAHSDINYDSSTKQKVASLIKVKNKKELQSVLGYHIVAGKLTASRILKALCRGKGKTTFTTISGEILTATMSGLDIILTDEKGNQSSIIKADANQCNGVFHEIDSIKPSKA